MQNPGHCNRCFTHLAWEDGQLWYVVYVFFFCIRSWLYLDNVQEQLGLEVSLLLVKYHPYKLTMLLPDTFSSQDEWRICVATIE